MKNLRDSYRFYRKSEKEEGVERVGINTYLAITQLFMKFLVQKVHDGYRVSLPERLGYLYIRGKKQKPKVGKDGNIVGLAPDWKKTREFWEKNPKAKEENKIIYFTNEHTDSVRYRYHWKKRGVFFKHGQLYCLRMTRTNKRTLAKLIKDGKDYVTYE